MKNYILKSFTLLIILSLTIGLSAHNQDKKDGSRTAEKTIQKLDSNKDGKLSKDEASKETRGRLGDNFSTIDSNSDGYIDNKELKTYRSSQKHERRK